MSHDTFWTTDPSELLRVRPGFRLADQPTDGAPGFEGGKEEGKDALSAGKDVLAELQEKLFACGREGAPRSVLLVLQAMDTAGKGGIVSHVIGAMNPGGVHYAGFGKPTPEELSHDFLWRVWREVPAAGQVGVFDRSHYEDVLIGRVRQLAPPEELERRYGAITGFEHELAESGTTIVKVMLHLGKAEQKKRLAARLENRAKLWKFNPADVDERLRWDDYQEAYQIALERTSTAEAPWFVVPADHKWYARVAVQQLLIRALEGLDLEWPMPDYDVEEQKRRLADS
ncbi:polyphosphate:nucleotide phosphotransferase, PPK2 family [Leifsonia sp. 98AMF]|uniref:polyphosphate kinase 2 family protein n=1 Tax=unclassified Leifsonia TaxID=2663824 RepID=UPI00035CA728|nr:MULTISPECIES: polyphosphate kinase 2 family protein [unclassified Leifsonia]TDQ02237.1 PPK2 family polyphosphate:nucleotide phosphotransferase [Leifsonia sp. 115AMFTsu3.1]SDH06165.1 polyphosphate:nucleotide phosphotransferase, PPK2 family [Leifsonia sp. 197AMF]SDJ34202.1 polyphosphate:nucleotide phosphotransferase, PPK2 family [Leifsonia sp. 466MF]SDK45680.1 polyphosphate:nucleotide phosphotransferase, PPK2 family [Leifsonia sp. 157MF]SDN55027.1 polyphosphate:nucleotide phosphotransferase, 